MSAYIKFTNKSSYPVVSVYSDDLAVCENILNNSTTKTFYFPCGTMEFSIKEHHQKTFQSLWISLYPDNFYELIIKNNSSCLVNDQNNRAVSAL